MIVDDKANLKFPILQVPLRTSQQMELQQQQQRINLEVCIVLFVFTQHKTL